MIIFTMSLSGHLYFVIWPDIIWFGLPAHFFLLLRQQFYAGFSGTAACLVLFSLISDGGVARNYSLKLTSSSFDRGNGSVVLS